MQQYPCPSSARCLPRRGRQGAQRRGSRKDLAPGQPAGSRIVFKRRGRSLEVDIPPAGISGLAMSLGVCGLEASAVLGLSSCVWLPRHPCRTDS